MLAYGRPALAEGSYPLINSSFEAFDAWSSEELGAKYEVINQPSLSLEGHYYECCFLPK